MVVAPLGVPEMFGAWSLGWSRHLKPEFQLFWVFFAFSLFRKKQIFYDECLVGLRFLHGSDGYTVSGLLSNIQIHSHLDR